MIIETCPRCGHELMDTMICTYPPIPAKDCPNCGWSWEGKREEVKTVPHTGQMMQTYELNLDKTKSIVDYIKIVRFLCKVVLQPTPVGVEYNGFEEVREYFEVK